MMRRVIAKMLPEEGRAWLDRAQHRFVAAKDEVREATAAAFPLGALVKVRLGVADVEGVVTAYGLTNPFEVRIINCRTAKARTFHSTFHNAVVVKERA